MKIGSLFSGVGGLEFGLERAGVGHTVWQVEQDAYCRGVLARHWPKATRYEDVRSVGVGLERVDLICGGFPCQDISLAGSGTGIDGARSGLWAEYARIVGELRPRFVVIENVVALRKRGLDRVLGDLAARGYDALWFDLQAADVGAPHKRARLFVVAWRVPDADSGRREALGLAGSEGQRGQHGARGDEPDGPDMPQWPPAPDDLHAWGRVPAASQPAVCRVADGLSARVDRARLRALGNAVVPDCAEVVGHVVLGIARRLNG